MILGLTLSLQLCFECMGVHVESQDVRDHLNELAELATRASGFMGTGFAAEDTVAPVSSPQVTSWQTL